MVTRTDMQNAVMMACGTLSSYRLADPLQQDAFVTARLETGANKEKLDIRMHWNWFNMGWRSRHALDQLIRETGSKPDATAK